MLLAFRSGDRQAGQYLEAYKRNLYCVKSADLNGQLPADITGQFVTNNMPQLYPRDAMMCARVLLLTGHAEEAKQIIEFWAKPDIPMKSPGEWHARYDAHGKAVDGRVADCRENGSRVWRHGSGGALQCNSANDLCSSPADVRPRW